MKQYELRSTNQKGKYFDIRRLIKPFKKYIVFMIMGQRGIGKSTTGYFHVIKEAILRDVKFFWMFQFLEEVKNKKNVFKKLEPILKEKFKWFRGEIVLEKHDIYYIERMEYTAKSGALRHRMLSKKHIGSVVALSDFSNVRGGVYEGYGNGICDEYQLEKGSYIKDYGNAVISLAETFLRTNPNAKIFMFSNRVDPACPLHVELGFKDSYNLKPNHFYLLSSKSTLMIYLPTSKSLQIDKDNSAVGRAFKDTKYYQYAHGNNWLKSIDNIPIKTFNNFIPIYNIVYNNSTYGVFRGDNFIFMSERTSNKKTYGATRDDCFKNQLDWELSKIKIKSLIKKNGANKLFFENELLFYIFIDVFK